MKKLEAFFGRVGCKKKLSEEILKVIPNHYIYGEPFVGGGTIFLKKQECDKEYINDLDKNLMEGYTLLKNVSSNEELLKIMVKNTNKIENIKNIQKFIEEESKNDNHKLLKQLYISRNTFSFKGFGKIFKHSIHLDKIKNIELYKERLKNTNILSEDYKSFILKIDSKDTFFYIDPPYENSVDLYKNVNINFEEMRDLLNKIKGKFLLSLNDSENIRQIF
jgi:DNA adenine methylase